MNAPGQAGILVLPNHRTSLYGLIRADLIRAALDQRIGGAEEHLTFLDKLGSFLRLTTQAVFVYRLLHWARRMRIPVIRQLLILGLSIYRRIVIFLTGIMIDPQAEIGPGLVVHTPFAVFVGGTKIGSNCTVQSGVLIPTGSRGVGDNVYFGPGAKLLADTKVGNNVVIVANSLVLTDVPDNTTIVGVPARIRLKGGRPQRFKRVVHTDN